MPNPGRERWMLLSLAAIQFTNTLDFMVMMPLAPQFTQVFGLSAQQFGALISTYTLAAGAAGVAAALGMERYDRKRALLVVYAGFILASIACAAAQNYAMLLAGRALAGMFGGVLGAVIFTIIGDTIPDSRRGRATGVVMTSFSVATVAGVPLALFLVNASDWRAAFFLVAILSLANVIAAWKLLPAVRHHLTFPGRHSAWQALVQTLSCPNHWRAFGFTVLLMLSGFAVIPYVSLYLTGNVGVGFDELGYVYLVGGVATFFSARGFGHLADRIGKLATYRWVAIASLAPILLITHVPVLPFAAVLAMATLFFVFVSGRMIPGLALVTGAAQPRLRGTFMSLNGAVLQFSSGLAVYLSGAMIERGADGRLQHYNLVGWMAVACTLLALWWGARVELVDAVPELETAPEARI